MDEELRSEAKKEIYDALVNHTIEGDRIKDIFRDKFEPYRHHPYPMNRVGNFARVTVSYLENWINLPRLSSHLWEFPSVAARFRDMGFNPRIWEDRWRAKELVKEVVCDIGSATYTPEWSDPAAPDQNQEVIAPWTAITPDANNFLARTLDDYVISFFNQRPREYIRILDLGVGYGDTIVPLVERMSGLKNSGVIPDDYSDYCDIYLADVSPVALMNTVSRLMRRMPCFSGDDFTPAVTMKQVRANFAELPSHPVLRGMESEFDIIISGAAICHQTDPFPFFEFMHKLLLPGGRMHVWDWHNGYSFAAPNLRLSKDGKRRTQFYLDIEGHPVPFEISEDGYCETNRMGDFFTLQERARGMNVVYELTEGDVDIIRANFVTWLGFLGYFYKEERGSWHSATRGQKDVSNYFHERFDKGLRSRQGFSFINGFLPKLMDLDAVHRSAYYILEGTGADYEELMYLAGFSSAHTANFLEMYSANRASALKCHTTRMQSNQIYYTMGRK